MYGTYPIRLQPPRMALRPIRLIYKIYLLTFMRNAHNNRLKNNWRLEKEFFRKKIFVKRPLCLEIIWWRGASTWIDDGTTLTGVMACNLFFDSRLRSNFELSCKSPIALSTWSNVIAFTASSGGTCIVEPRFWSYWKPELLRFDKD